MKVEYIKIENFRQINPMSQIEVGDKITLIAGPNATCKSSILGMICQPFGFDSKVGGTKKIYTDNYDDVDMSILRTIDGKSFQSSTSEIFRLSPKYDDPNKEGKRYKYFVGIQDENGKSELPVQTQKRGKEKPRFVAGKGHKEGEGNYPHPVIYLGLNRLYPLANSKKVKVFNENDGLDEEERKLYVQWHKEVTILDDIQPERIETENKKYLGGKTEQYDAETNSAGQSNLGIIFTAILSFKRLKQQLGNKYRGGILVIDEVDATLHVLAQKKLLKVFSDAADKFDLQIICTTHSQDMLKEAFQRFHNDIKIVALYRSGKILVKNNPGRDEIISEIASIDLEKKSDCKVTLFLEDVVAWELFKTITNNKLSHLCKSNFSKAQKDVSLDASTLIRLSSRNIEELKNVIYIVDGDQSANIKKGSKVVALPGQKALEEEAYLFLSKLPEDDEFWNRKLGFNGKEICFKDYPNLGDTNKTNDYKKWFSNIRTRNDKLFGVGGKKLYKYWIQAHKDECKKFVNDFDKVYKKVVSKALDRNLLNDILDGIDNL